MSQCSEQEPQSSNYSIMPSDPNVFYSPFPCFQRVLHLHDARFDWLSIEFTGFGRDTKQEGANWVLHLCPVVA